MLFTAQIVSKLELCHDKKQSLWLDNEVLLYKILIDSVQFYQQYGEHSLTSSAHISILLFKFFFCLAMVYRRRLDSEGSSLSGSTSSSILSSNQNTSVSSITSSRSLNNTMNTTLDILEEEALNLGVCVQVDIPDGR